MRLLGIAAALVALVLMSGVFTSPQKADAQYIVGPIIILSVSQNTTTPGGEVIVTAQYVDEDGNPIPGAIIHFTIVAGPPGAFVGSRTIAKTTDAHGMASATLHTVEGETGSVILQVTNDAGDVISTTVVRIVGPGAAAPSGPSPAQPIAPTGGVGGSIVPPNTGSAGLLDNRVDPIGPAGLLLVAVMLTLAVHFQSRPAPEGEAGKADK